jgi:hypothetical protein
LEVYIIRPVILTLSFMQPNQLTIFGGGGGGVTMAMGSPLRVISIDFLDLTPFS